MSDRDRAARGLEIATETAGLLAIIGELALQACAATDPSTLRRVREVIIGELRTEQVLAAGEARAKELEGEPG